jgi:hypothetical protein
LLSMLLGCVHSFGILLVVYMSMQGVVGDVISLQACEG